MKKNNINKKREKEIIVLSQIFILIIGIIAIGYSVGSEIKFVSGAETPATGGYSYFSGIDSSLFPGAKSNLPAAKSTSDALKGITGTTMKIPGDNTYEYMKTADGTYYTRKVGSSGDWKSLKGNEEAIKRLDTQGQVVGTTKPTTVEGLWAGMGHGFLGNVAQGVYWGAMVAGMIYFILPILGASEGLTKALTKSAFGGIVAGKAAIGIVDQWGVFGTSSGWLTEQGYLGLSKGTMLGAGVGIAAGIIIFYKTYEQVDKKVVEFTCLPWQAPTGGDKCEECNKQGDLPCSEYQCRSLGQSCELINQGTDNEQCVWVNKNDVEYPTIEPWNDVLLKDYKYSPDNTISPPDRGVKIEYTPSTSKCVKSFTPLSFGVSLNEPAMCKIDLERKKNFEDMNFFMSGGLALYNHSYTLSLPGLAALNSENITIQNNGEYELAVKCQDANGNSNTADFVFKFCVEKGPDTTPPLIITTSIPSENPIAYGQTDVDIDVYVNEPSECKWSHLDQTYENMENDMVCSTSVYEMNAQMLYTCKTTLTGLKDRVENQFYFRCEDSAGNTNKESYEFSLIGTQPLVIDWAKPEDGSIIKDSTESVKVTLEAKTSAGYNEGEATCYYSGTGETTDYIMFYNTNSYEHSQDLWLPEGEYTYYIKCLDLGGNSDVETVTFSVESDANPPIVVRALHEETYLRLITDEAARCVYDTKYENYPCDYLFNDGIEMTTVSDVNHYTEWNTRR